MRQSLTSRAGEREVRPRWPAAGTSGDLSRLTGRSTTPIADSITLAPKG
ncbi:hypothetical protein [Saccharothrix deserti]|nr:hypothetical protein [Saccharothrix deserti]